MLPKVMFHRESSKLSGAYSATSQTTANGKRKRRRPKAGSRNPMPPID
jgi:hypothetical protein